MPKFPTFPSLDFSALDARKLADLDDKLVSLARDAAYVSIGFGVLTVQQLQVRRREIAQMLSQRVDARKDRVEELVKSVDAHFGSIDARLTSLEHTLDRAVEQLEERLPEQAAAVVGQAHGLAKAPRHQVRRHIRSA